MLFQMVHFAMPISHERAAHFFVRRSRVTPERNFNEGPGADPVTGMPQRFLSCVCAVSGAANMHRERCTGRITEAGENLTPLSRVAQDIGNKKNPASGA